MKALSFFQRTSSRASFNLASWHSPHSMTWRWILALRWQPGDRFHLKPWGFLGFGLFGAGIGHLLSGSISRNNNGWQLSFCLFWLELSWMQQKPLWYRDVYLRERAERERLNEDLRRRFMSRDA